MASTRAFLKVGSEYKTVTKGDVLELLNGDKFTFIEMRRSKWVGKSHKDGKQYLVHGIIKSLAGRDESVNEGNVAASKLKRGDLFAIDGKKETFMFQRVDPSGKIKAVNIADLGNWTIDSNFKLKMVDVKKIKEALV